MAKKKRYNYIKKEIAKGSYQALTAAVISLLLLIFSLIFSVVRMGEGPLLLGAVGLCSIMAAVWSLYYMIQAHRDENKNFYLAQGSGAAAVLLIVIWTVIVIIGLKG